MLLEKLIETYIASRNEERPIGQELAARTQLHLADCVRAYGAWLQHEAVLTDLNPLSVNDFLRWLIEAGQSPYTARNRRSGLLVLWRFAERSGLTDEQSTRVRRVHCPTLQVDGYAIDQAQVLLSRASELRGTIRYTKIPRRIYWGSLLPTKWDFGLRAGDVLGVRVVDFNPDGQLWVYEHKTGKRGWRILRPETRDAIAECVAVSPNREFIWPGLRPRSFYRAFSRLAKASGLPGTSRWVRRGSSSEVEKLHPGAGWRFLNHSNPDVFEKHYRVRRICDSNPLLPPSIRRESHGD